MAVPAHHQVFVFQAMPAAAAAAASSKTLLLALSLQNLSWPGTSQFEIGFTMLTHRSPPSLKASESGFGGSLPTAGSAFIAPGKLGSQGPRSQPLSGNTQCPVVRQVHYQTRSPARFASAMGRGSSNPTQSSPGRMLLPPLGPGPRLPCWPPPGVIRGRVYRRKARPIKKRSKQIVTAAPPTPGRHRRCLRACSSPTPSDRSRHTRTNRRRSVTEICNRGYAASWFFPRKKR